MTRINSPLLAVLALTMTISACGRVADSRLNPFNWFGRDRSEAVVVEAETATVDGRQLVSQVTELAVDATPGGAIIRAVGLPATQGYWNAVLERVETADPTVIIYEFRLMPPPGPRRQSTQQSREIIAGATLTNIALNGVRSIVVRGQQNQRSVRR